MGKKNKKKNIAVIKPSAVVQPAKKQIPSLFPWLLILIFVTAICFFPMLKNELTNWDDDFYVNQNLLLRGPDWKGIFSQPVVGNYHPLTILTLALNYQWSGLSSFSYLLVNYVLHLVNTVLVFYFIYRISGRQIWVGFITALVFGIHPMHVESVAWVAERKDVLYTLFFFLSLIQYWQYLETGARKNYWFCFLFFVLSLLSKPAAVILPLILFLLDYWKGRPLKKIAITEKIMFLGLSLLFGIITLKIQSPTAITGTETFPLWTRPLFACYVIMTYFLKFFIPYPLSAFHPYPTIDNIGFIIYSSPLFVAALGIVTWLLRKHKFVLFGISFFIINLLLVLQVLTIGSTIVSERYTYVPYIGLAFALGMWLNSAIKNAMAKIVIAAVVCLGFGIVTYQQTGVWRNSETLWTNAIYFYPVAAVPRNQRAIYYGQLSDNAGSKEQATVLLQKALEDCNVALKVKPDYINALENRQRIYLNTNKNTEALADAESLVRLDSNNYKAHYTKGVAYDRLNEPEKAIAVLEKCIIINPNDDQTMNMLGSILVNRTQKYKEALALFDKAIVINPAGVYYMNRSICYYKMEDIPKARFDAETAIQKGIAIPNDYLRTLDIK